MLSGECTVFVIDDDEAICDFLTTLFGLSGFQTKAFTSAEAFLNSLDQEIPGCILLDVRMPGMSGLELQRELLNRRNRLPVIILTGRGDVSMAVHAMKMGAFDFVEKPFDNDELLARVRAAVADAAARIEADIEWQSIEARIKYLTPRELQILDLVAAGETNKGIAYRLGISAKTVEVHRANAMHKMNAKSIAALVRMLDCYKRGRGKSELNRKNR